MYKKWLQWQEDAALDSVINSLLAERRQKKMEIYHHQYQLEQQEFKVAKIRSNLYSAQRAYEDLDLELATIDGRMRIVRIEVTKKKEKDVLSDIEKMPLKKRLELMNWLRDQLR